MTWSIGFDDSWQRDIGYGVPAYCDYPSCNNEIHRGLGYVCGSEPYGGDRGCGLFFCSEHIGCNSLCDHCNAQTGDTHGPKRDHPTWINHKLTHESWAQWRSENPDDVSRLEREAAGG